MKLHLPLIILTCLGLQLSAQIKNTYSFARGDTTQVTISWDAWAMSGDAVLGCNIYRLENPDTPLNETLITSPDSTFQFIDETGLDPDTPPKYLIRAIRSSDTLEVAYAHGFSSIEFKTMGTDSVLIEVVVWNTDMCCLGVYVYLDDIVAGFFEYHDPFIISPTFWNPIYIPGHDIKLQFFSEYGPYADLTITEEFYAFLHTTVGIPELPEAVSQGNVFPNPLTEASAISFYLAEGSYIQLDIFNLAGRKVKSVFEGHLPSGAHKFNISNNGFAPGLYFYRLYTTTKSMAGKMIVK